MSFYPSVWENQSNSRITACMRLWILTGFRKFNKL